ncbi:LicD family protein [Enterocloster citroniae]|uniref:LicD family protein n=2 Tax=Enterocloster citroniae TaxID=358743 RepID=UPI00189B5BED|nr:LicD family protein [Enterocloster citroniae]
MSIQCDNNHLSKVQQYILDLLKEVIGIMDSMNITYYMQGGTMLGAIRHKGFIPWDDDVDLGLPRADYENFITNVKKFLPADMELRTYWDDTDHHYYFARIVDSRYKIKRNGSMTVRYENVWIDIFPLDGMPNEKPAQTVHKIRLTYYRLCFHLSTLDKVNISRPGRSLIEKIIIKIAAVTNIGKLFNSKKCLDNIDKLLRRYPLSESKWIINFTGQTSYHFNELFKKEVYGKLTKYAFEDLFMYGPEDYDKYLTSLYGDYMTPPKEGDRNAHGAEIV